jgi:xanthine phosphoribosyltransferase
MKHYSSEDLKRDLINSSIKKPDAIVAVARGGLTFAHHLAEKLNMREVFTINAVSYEKDKKLNTLKIFNIPDLEKYNNILVVDDISDSGDTFIEVIKTFKNHYPDKQFQTIAIFYKPTSKFKPDFYFHETKEWINFFWEVY